ncbi:MAG: hypothetical protein JWN67_5047 [Actinomycetia bacterium]|nr:hypothetical protein [Actinomycetes bacterium]
MIAFVAAITPALTVQIPGATVATPAQWKASTVPTLAVNDRVEVEVDEFTREVKVLAKLVAA